MFNSKLISTALLFGILTSCSYATTPKPKQAHSLTIITLNLANYDDHADWSERLKLIADEIQKSHADVVALQEVRFNPDHPSNRENYQNMAEQILYELNNRGDFLNATLVTQPVMYYPHSMTGKLGWHYYPLPARLAPKNEPYLWEGLSIISKLRIIETGNYFLSVAKNCNNDNRRVTQYIKIENDKQPLYIANIHFSGKECLAQNTKETLAYLHSQIKSSSLLIMGDFNARPDDAIFKDFKKLGMVDVWEKLHPAEKGFTSSTTDSMIMDQRIDFVWANPSVAKKLLRPEQIWLIGNKPKSNLYPSDHFGLAVTFSNTIPVM